MQKKKLKKQGYKSTILAAQEQAVPFYEKLGYHICSDSFIDANIKHYLMEKIF